MNISILSSGQKNKATNPLMQAANWGELGLKVAPNFIVHNPEHRAVNSHAVRPTDFFTLHIL
jgi:hypothetical protein